VTEKMENAPVYYALAQAQFNPVAAMAKYADDFQDRLRRKGFTLYEPKHGVQLQFSTQPGVAPEPKITPMVSWLITKADRTAGFILGPSSLAFHTTHYETHNEFIQELLFGLEVLHEVVSLEHVSRLGLRYLDAVLPQAGENTEQYLADGLHGISVDATPRQALNEQVFDVKSGPLVMNATLALRVYRLTAALGYPPDMLPSGLTPKERFANTGIRTHAVIDIDHFVEGQMALDLSKIGEQLVTLHAATKLAFKAATSNHARAVWA
jgi:uncharacterized protein (TIGR04255 family)